MPSRLKLALHVHERHERRRSCERDRVITPRWLQQQRRGEYRKVRRVVWNEISPLFRALLGVLVVSPGNVRKVGCNVVGVARELLANVESRGRGERRLPGGLERRPEEAFFSQTGRPLCGLFNGVAPCV